MSDVSVLSNHYETLIETSDKINDSIIALKKQYLLSERKEAKYKALEIKPQEVANATTYLIHFLSELEALLEDKKKAPEDIPNVIANDYAKNLETNLPNIKNEVTEIVTQLNAEQLLDFEQLTTLDKILITLDGERKILFRKLRSSRA